jgi:hypothetical protein
MRLPIAIGAILVASLGLNAPVMSLPPTHGAKAEINNSNLTQLRLIANCGIRKKLTTIATNLAIIVFVFPILEDQ